MWSEVASGWAGPIRSPPEPTVGSGPPVRRREIRPYLGELIPRGPAKLGRLRMGTDGSWKGMATPVLGVLRGCRILAPRWLASQ